MKTKILAAALALGILGSIPQANAGLVGLAVFGSGAVVSPSGSKRKTTLWLLTAASAGAVYGGIRLLKVGGVLGVTGGIAVILLDEPNQLKSGNLEEYFLMAYPEIDDRSFIARIAAYAAQHATLIPATHRDAIPGSELIDVRGSENEVNALLEEAILTDGTISRLREDLL